MLKEYFSINEILELKLEGFLDRRNLEIKVAKENWLFQVTRLSHSDKPVKEYHISNFPARTREKIVVKLLERATKEARLNGKNIEVVQKSLKIAYSRLEIILFVKKTKVKVDVFCKFYNNREFANNEITQDCFENVPSISKTRVYEWIKQYDKLGLEGIKFKADERRLGKGSTSKLDLVIKDGDKIKKTNIKEVIIGIHLDNPHWHVKLLYKNLLRRISNSNVSIPSYRNVCKILRDWRLNNKAIEELITNPDKYKGNRQLAIGSYSMEATEPNYMWEMDSTPIDVMFADGRHTLIGCIDVYSRRLKFLVSKTSNSLAITNLLRACILDWGLPKIIKTDNGSDYVSQQIVSVFSKLNIQHRRTGVGKGEQKPHVERVFGRFQHDEVPALPGYIGHNIAKRKDIEARKGFIERLFGKQKIDYWTPEMFQAFCNAWIEEEYMPIPHHGLKMKTPNSMLEGFIPKLPSPENKFDLLLLLEPLAGVRSIVKKGIRVENAFYWNPNLSYYIGKQVEVRVDRLDMGKIYVFDTQKNFICEAINYELEGVDRIAFVEQSKKLEKQAMKLAKEQTRRIIKNTKKLDYIEPLQIDLEEFIDEEKNKSLLIQEYQEYQEEIKVEDEGEIRFAKAMELEDLISKNLEYTISEVDLNWLKFYQTDGEYKAKLSLMKDFEVQEGIQNIEQESNKLETLEIGDKKWQ